MFVKTHFVYHVYSNQSLQKVMQRMSLTHISLKSIYLFKSSTY